jgi:hypothetical protein
VTSIAPAEASAQPELVPLSSARATHGKAARIVPATMQHQKRIAGN